MLFKLLKSLASELVCSVILHYTRMIDWNKPFPLSLHSYFHKYFESGKKYDIIDFLCTACSGASSANTLFFIASIISLSAQNSIVFFFNLACSDSLNFLCALKQNISHLQKCTGRQPEIQMFPETCDHCFCWCKVAHRGFACSGTLTAHCF